MYKLGIDIGGTKINIGLLDERKNSVLKHKEILPKNKECKSVLSSIMKALDSLLSENNISREQIKKCGIGVPGTVSEDGKMAVKVPNLGWENENIADKFKDETGIPTKLVQDSRAAAWGEYVAGNGKNRKIVVCITLGTGIGTGIVIDGKIFDGALGGAGELGHIPIVPDGRKCGCGKSGCLESYYAGKGLDMTAKEIFGENASAKDIFEGAKNGNDKAKEILRDAVLKLGEAIVAMTNLLSPDCLLLSGGMSEQTELLINPLMNYIKEHSYSTPEYIGLAALGTDAPMVGAALLPQEVNTRIPKIAASVMCADILHLEEDLKKLEEAKIDYLHFDVMDGHFVPNLMLPVEMINKVRCGTKLPFDIHLMVENPESIIPKIKLQKGDIVSVHWESTPHVQRAISLILDAGADAALAINPSTPIECVRELLPDINMLLVMTVNPGYAGQKIVPQSFDKIKRARKYLDDLGYENIMLQVDGNCSFENVPKMFAAGADNFVVGSSSVFKVGSSIQDNTDKLYSLI